LLAQIHAHGGAIAGVYYCLHHPEENCGCRKPRPGLLLQAAQELGFDLRRAVVVGDSWRDIGAAAAVGARGILVKTGLRNEPPPPGQQPTPQAVVEDMVEAARQILKWRQEECQ